MQPDARADSRGRRACCPELLPRAGDGTRAATRGGEADTLGRSGMLAGGRTPPLTGRPGMRPGVRLSSRRRDTSRDRRPRAPARDRGWRGQRRSRRVESDAARNQEIHGSESVDDRRAMPPRVQASSEVSRDHEQGRPVTTVSVRHHPSLFLRGEADTRGDEARAPGGPGRRSGDTREALRPSWDVTQAVRGCGNVTAVKARLQPADACHREGIRVCAAMEDIRVCAAMEHIRVCAAKGDG